MKRRMSVCIDNIGSFKKFIVVFMSFASGLWNVAS